MGKNKKRGSDGSSGSAGGATARKARVVKPFVERLIDKSEVIFARGSEIALACEKRGVPREVTTVAKDFLGFAEKFREAFFGLRTSGWVPVKKASSQGPLAIGDKVTIVDQPEIRARYSYLPGGAEIEMAVKDMIPRGKSFEVLVVPVGSEQSCGYIPRNHLVRV